MPEKIISEARKAAARANGAKSRGPITPEGKARSSMNGLTHGLTMKALLLPEECPEAAQKLLDAYAAELNPEGMIECDLVLSLAFYRWQLIRAQAMQTGFFKNTQTRHNTLTDEEFAETDNLSRIAEVFRHTTQEDGGFRLLMRYMNDLRRNFSATLRDFKLVQAMRNQQNTIEEEPGVTQPEEMQTKPKPVVENPPQPVKIDPQTPRNALCPCHSGLKYKRCCGPKAPPVLGRAA